MSVRKFNEVFFFLPSTVLDREITLNNGHKFPMVTFGTSKLEISEVYSSIDAALDAGYRSFESDSSSNTEEYLGVALEELLPKYNLKRNNVFITGKLSPKHYGLYDATKTFWKTCKKLKTNYLDAYLMNWPGAHNVDPDSEENLCSRVETWSELSELLMKGAVKNIGVCNFNIKHLEYLKLMSPVIPAINQVEFHPRFPQKELLNYCKDNNILMQAISFKDTLHPLLLSDTTLFKVSKKVKKTITQITLRWILNKGVAVIPQSKHKCEIKKNFLIYDFVLEKPEMEAIDSISIREKYLPNPLIVI